MFKLIGIFCILAGCVGWGSIKIREEQSRVRHLRELIRIIKRIQDEISYGKHTLPEICLTLSEYCSEPYKSHFGQIYEKMDQSGGAGFDRIWDEEIKQCLQDAPLTEEEKDILRKITGNLGMQDEKLQAANIGQSMDLLVRKCRNAEDNYENRARMILSVSVLTGVFLTILLV